MDSTSAIEIPTVLHDPRFTQAWAEWLQYRGERRLTRSSRCLNRQLKLLAELGVEKAVASIEQSLTQGWQGLFEPRGRFDSKANTTYQGLREFAQRAREDGTLHGGES